MKFNFSFINLGCNKNLVDSQFLMGKIFSIAGNNPNYELNYSTDPFEQENDFVFLNTCGFISSGRYEMFENIEKLLNENKTIYLIWCGLYYFKKVWNDKWNMVDQKEVEIWEKFLENENLHLISWNDRDKISIDSLMMWFDSQEFKECEIYKWTRAYTNAEFWFEYLKIAEWCNNHCSFCIIPKIRWKQKSMKIEKIIKEAKNMLNSGIKEIILIAQDTNKYWVDLYWKPSLIELLEEIEKIEWDFVYRILYLYPDILTLKQLEKLKNMKKFIPYFDIPLQHINENILKKMGRFYDKKHIFKILEYIKDNFEQNFIRTNIIIWFPGETEGNFQELCDLVESNYFDNIAFFEYHDEPFAKSSKLKNKIDEKIIRKRFDKIVWICNSQNKWKNKNDESLWFIMWLEEKNWNQKLIVRNWLNAPEIDPYAKINIKNILENIDWDGMLEIWNRILYKTN